jgi:hypothetical protein
MTLPRLRREDREAGSSLIELMVVLVMLALVLPVAYGTVNSMQNETSITSNRFRAVNEGQVISDRITKDLRTGVSPANGLAPFLKATTNEVQFYASLADPNGPTLLDAYVQPIPGTNVNAFHEDQTPVTPNSSPYTWNAANLQVRLDGQYIDTTVPTIFTYFDNNNQALLPDGTGALDAGQRLNIDSVGITLTTRILPGAPASTITTLVHIRNVDYNPNG